MPDQFPFSRSDHSLIPTRTGGLLIRVRPERVDDDLRYFNEHKLAGIECEGALLPVVHSAKPRQLSLRGIDDDKQLDVLHDMTWLHTLGGYSSGSYKPALDLGRFPDLEGFNWGNWTPKMVFPREMSKLRWVGLSKYRHGRKGQLPESLPALTGLSLGYLDKTPTLPPLPDAPLVDSLDIVVGGLEQMGDLADQYPGIRRLHLGHLPKLANIEVVRSLNHLRRVELENLRSLTDLSPLGDCGGLREVFIHGCKNIESVGWVALVDLERFHMFDSKVADGDMSSLFGIQDLDFDNRRHYSHSSEEVQSADAQSDVATTPRVEEVDHSDISVDLETDDQGVVDGWSTRLPELVAAARQRLANDPGESGLLYAEHHIAEIEPEAWESVHGLGHVPTVQELLGLLQPVSLWGDPAEGLHLDFSIGEDLTQYVISFNVHLDGTLGDIDMES